MLHLCRRTDCYPRGHQRGSIRRHPLHTPRDICYAVSSTECLAAIYPPENTNKSKRVQACTEIGKNIKSVIPHCKWSPWPKCFEPNDEIQMDFGGPIFNEKGIEQYFITSIDRYLNYPKAEIINNASGTNVIRFVNNYIYNHGVPRTIISDQARCFTGKKFEFFCTEN